MEATKNWTTISQEGGFKTKMRVRSNQTFEVEYDQSDMQEILDVNVALQNADRRTSSLWNGRDAVHVATIPNELIVKWMREGINFYRGNEDDRARVLQKLNDRDYCHLRVDDPGRTL